MASTVSAFEAKFDKFWRDQPVKFNFWEELLTQINDLDKEDNCILREEYSDDDDDDEKRVQTQPT